jgi:hypothetical protein
VGDARILCGRCASKANNTTPILAFADEHTMVRDSIEDRLWYDVCRERRRPELGAGFAAKLGEF